MRRRQRTRFRLRLALDADGSEADAQRAHLPVLRRQRRLRHTREDLLQEPFELVTGDVALEFEALDADRGQPVAPVPILEVTQRVASVDDFPIEERERPPRGSVQTGQRLIGAVDGPFTRRMAVRVERHGGNRLPERVQETAGSSAAPHRLPELWV